MRNIVIRLAAGIAFSAMVTVASAAVYGPQQQLPAATIESFKANPSQLLQQFPQGEALTARVRDLGASDPTTIPGLISLLKSSDRVTQMPAIAAGLAQLAKLAAARGDQALTNDIAVAVAGAQDPDALKAYQIALGDVPILSTGGGAAGGGGTGGGGQTGTTGLTNGGGGGGGAATFGARSYATSPTPGGSTGFSSASTGASASVSAQ